jgi:arylsulfatase A-like enzyme/Flp pilus assembly protein TadD
MGRRRKRSRADAPDTTPPTPVADASPTRRRKAPLVFALALVGVAVGVAALLLSYWKQPPRTEAEARAALSRLRPDASGLNLVVVTLDTTRADRLGCYGFRGVDTPNIDALARDGIVFDHATATVPLTFPSHSSIFTGLVPPHHGVHDNGGFFLDDAKVTLAERLREKGFATGAFVAAWVLDRKWGLAQGFDEYSDKFDLSKYKVVSLGTVQKPGDEVMDGALAWLETVKQRRFFAWVHLYDPHTPYDPPEPFASRYPSQPYLGEIAYTDQVVGRLLKWLREQRLDERTIVVLTADHGESLGDHGESTHAYFVYDATTHVPLVVRTPWRIRGRRSVQVSSVDLMPTVLDLLGLPPQPGIDGRSLARELLDPAAASPDRVAYSETYFPRYHFGWQHLRAIRSRAYKYVEAPEPELYDLAQDPGETKNIYRGFSARAENLRLRLEELTRQESGVTPERRSLDPETLQRLAALGYVGNVIDVDASAVLPDPKEKLPLFAMMNAAKRLAQDEDKVEEGVARMREVLRRDPKIMDAQITLGNWLLRLRKPDEAAEAFKQALALKPDDDIALGNLASVLMAHGKQQDALAALEVFRTALRVNPKNPQSWFQLARLYLDMGRVDEARSSFTEALAANPKQAAALNGLGAIAFENGELPKAETMVREALALEPRLRTGRYNLARIREARGDVAGAEALYREELETYADNGRARFNLAQIRRAQGDRTGYLSELNDCVAKAHEFGACYFYLAREELDAGRLDPAADLAKRGLEAQPRSDIAPLGHFVLADVYSRRGEGAKAEAEAAKGRKLEAALRKNPAPRI